VTAAAVPLGLPPGVDPASGWSEPIPAWATFNALRKFATVPTGQCWVVQSVWYSGLAGSGGTTDPTMAQVQVWDGDGNVVFETNPDNTAVAGDTYNAYFGLGMTASRVRLPTGGFTSMTGPLPWIAWPAGYTVQAILTTTGNPSRIDEGPVGWVISYDLGSLVGGGGPVVAEPVGPFLYTAGPSEL